MPSFASRPAHENWPKFTEEAGLGGKTVEAIAGEFEVALV